METDKEIISFSQSEKVKGGITWVTQALNMLQSLDGSEQKGGEQVISVLIQMIRQEVNFAKGVTGDDQWGEVDPHIEKAILMINSGVSNEATMHLSKALSHVTNVGQRSMGSLREKGLI
jgi:hypothetical protein